GVARAGREGGVGLAVGDVGAEAALLDGDRLAADRVGAELLERRFGGGGAAAPLGLGEDRQRAGEVDREQVRLRLERSGVAALLDVGAVAPVLGGDLDTVGGIDA